VKISAKTFEIASAIAMLVDSKDDGSSYREHIDSVRTEIKNTDPKVKLSSGMYRTAAVFKDFVVKFARDNRHEALKQEAEFIAKMRKNRKWGRHFPETHVLEVGGVTVLIQEKVDMSHRGRRDLQDAAEHLATRLGLDDMHEGNYGWKGPKGKEYPVFVDVDFRWNAEIPKARKRRSWEV
jgi:hypothetical protein